MFAGRSLACFSITKYIPDRSRRSDGYNSTKHLYDPPPPLVNLYFSCSSPPSLLYKRGFFTIANSAKKITSADRSKLLSSNMAAQLCSWTIIVYFAKRWLSFKQFKIRVRRSGSNFILKLIITRIYKRNSDWLRRQLRYFII